MLKEKTLKNGNTVLTGTTPKGEIQYAHVFEPQTKVGDQTIDPTYSVTIFLDGDDTAVQNIMSQLDEQLHIAEEMATEATSKVKGRKPKLPTCHDENFGPEVDEEGNETGRFYIKAKAKAEGVTQSGKKWKFTPPVFDGTNTPFPEKDPPLIGNGSVCRLAITAFPYAAPIGYGVSIKLDAMQVLKLVEYNGRDAESFGFEAEEDGYRVTKEEEATVFSDEEEEAQPTSYREQMNKAQAAENSDF